MAVAEVGVPKDDLERVKAAYAGSGLEKLAGRTAQRILSRPVYEGSASAAPQCLNLLEQVAPCLRTTPAIASVVLQVLHPIYFNDPIYGEPVYVDKDFSYVTHMVHPAINTPDRRKTFLQLLGVLTVPGNAPIAEKVIRALFPEAALRDWAGIEDIVIARARADRIPTVILSLTRSGAASLEAVILTATRPLPVNYVPYRLLGRGAASEAYLAYNEDSEDDIALKIVDSSISPAACRRNLAILRKLECPYIAKQYDPFRLDGQLVIPMEPFDTTLRHVIDEYKKEGSAVPAANALQWFEEMLIGLALCHQNDIIHQDLAPNNVGLKMVNGRYIVKLTDFNTGAYLSSKELKRGPLDYSSPDMLRASLKEEEYSITAQDTCWSLGVMLYEMLTGKLLFSDERLFPEPLPDRHRERETYKIQLANRASDLQEELGTSDFDCGSFNQFYNINFVREVPRFGAVLPAKTETATRLLGGCMSGRHDCFADFCSSALDKFSHETCAHLLRVAHCEDLMNHNSRLESHPLHRLILTLSLLSYVHDWD